MGLLNKADCNLIMNKQIRHFKKINIADSGKTIMNLFDNWSNNIKNEKS